MATPAFRAAGAAVFSANNVANPTALAPTKSGSTVNGDLMVLLTACRSITATVATPTGWTLVTGFPKRSSTASGGSIYAFVRVADGTANDAPSVSWSGVTTGTTGDSCGARILSYQNAIATMDGTPPAASDAASTTSITIPAHTTASPNSLVVGMAIRINDTAHTFTVATFTERSDDHTTTGTGHGTVSADKVNTTAGSSGTATVTPSNTTSSRTLAVSFGVRAAPTTLTLTPATLTSTAQALAFVKPILKTLGVATTSHSAQALAFAKPIVKTLTPVARTDVAQPLTFTQASGQTRTLTAATETGQAQPLGHLKLKPFDPAAETELAQALQVVKPIRKTLTPSGETDSGQPLVFTQPGGPVPIVPVAEVDQAQPLSHAKLKLLVPAGEQQLAQTLVIARALAAATETDVALALVLAGAVPAPSLTPPLTAHRLDGYGRAVRLGVTLLVALNVGGHAERLDSSAAVMLDRSEAVPLDD